MRQRLAPDLRLHAAIRSPYPVIRMAFELAQGLIWQCARAKMIVAAPQPDTLSGAEDMAKASTGNEPKWVYIFAAGHVDGRAGLSELLGGKGANLAEMARLGLPVPPGFTITTEVCDTYSAQGRKLPEELKSQIAVALQLISDETGVTFGDVNEPLLLSVRSGARASMPGMMDTILNLGLNDETVEGLAKRSGDRRMISRVEQFESTAKDLFRTVEEDPRDLTAARKFLSVYLMGARDATIKFADVYSRTHDTQARDDYEALLDDLELNFSARTRKMLLDDRSDLTVEIDVLRDRLQREGVRIDRDMK